VQDLLRRSLVRLYEHESDLLLLGAGERSLVHQLAVGLRRRTQAFWDVDCEYDRQGRGGAHKLLVPPRRAIPDVVVHQRGHGGPEANLLVVEAKRHWKGGEPPRADVAKVRGAIERFGFAYGVTMELLAKGEVTPRWMWWTFEAAEHSGRTDAKGRAVMCSGVEPIMSVAHLSRARDRGEMNMAGKERPSWSDWPQPPDDWPQPEDEIEPAFGHEPEFLAEVGLIERRHGWPSI
jgi:hypothetical protein